MADETHLLRKTLKLVKLFEGFSEDDVRDFFTWARRRDAEPGERVMEEGELSHEMYIVASGSLTLGKAIEANAPAGGNGVPAAAEVVEKKAE